MKDWHALWLHWTHPSGMSTGVAAGSSEPGRPSVVDSWLASGQQWWSWWLAAATAPWLRQPWPHAGEVDAPGLQDAAPPASALPPSQRGLPDVHGHAPDSRKAPIKRLESHKGRQLQRRKINPGG
jgi:hypothetical protein